MRAIYDYIIYTDGGCECNPGGRGGYGAVIINNNTGEFTDISGGFRSTTNNRMEVIWSRKKKDTIMDIKEYSTDIWDIIVDHFAETKYQMMCIRWCARGLALGDAIKKVQVDMEVAENCLANKKRNM